MRSSNLHPYRIGIVALAAWLGTAAGCAADGAVDQLAVTTAGVTGDRPYVGLLWSTEGDASSRYIADVVALADDQTSVAIDVDAPPAAAMYAAPLADGTVMSIAVAAVVLFDDVDGDGTFAVRADGEGLAGQDLVVGVGADAYLLYMETYPDAARATFVNPDDAHVGLMRAVAECQDLACRLRVLPDTTAISVDAIDAPSSEFPNCTLGSCSASGPT
jgi:hypothetical protein